RDVDCAASLQARYGPVLTHAVHTEALGNEVQSVDVRPRARPGDLGEELRRLAFGGRLDDARAPRRRRELAIARDLDRPEADDRSLAALHVARGQVMVHQPAP